MKKRVQPLPWGISYVSRNFVRFCLLWIFSLSSLMIQAQENQRITVDLRGETLEAALWYLQNRTKFVFMYATKDISGVSDVNVKAKDKTVTEILDECLAGTNLTYEVSGNAIVIKKRSTQNITITGWIRDSNGEALPGATVTIRGSKSGGIAGMDGNYTCIIPAQEGLVLTYSFIGMEKKVVKYTGKKTINITLNSSNTEIDEVVVTGYQNIQRRDLVGSITTLKAKDIVMPSYSTIDQMLQGRVAGMMVTSSSSRVGSAPQIKIRGTSTLIGNQDPLWVVDGIIQEDFSVDLDDSSLMTEDLKNIIGNQISWLNPADIENITILKDASATAIYGSKASNGVIEITTKRNTSDRLTVNYSSNFNIGQRPNYGMFNLMNSQERVQFSQDAFNWGTSYATVPYKELYTYEGLLRMYLEHDISESEYSNAYRTLETQNTDWLKLLTRRSFSHNHNVSVSGGTNKFSYSASMGYTNSEGQEIGNDSERMTGRISLLMRPVQKLTISVTMNGSVSTTTGFSGGVDPLGYATTTNRAIDPDVYYQKIRNYRYNNTHESLSYNFINERDNSGSKSRSTHMSASLDLKWNILDWLTYQFTGGYTDNNSTNESWLTEQTYYIANQYRGYDYNSVNPTSPEFKAAQLPFGGRLYTNNSNQYAYNIQNKIQISKAFNENNRLNALIGTEVRSTTGKGIRNTLYGYVPDRGERIVAPTTPEDFQPIGNPAFTGWGLLSDIYGSGWRKTNTTNNFFSVFATFAYSYMNRYVVNANVRNDASNRFGQDTNNRFDPTYSIGFSWRASEEKLIKEHLKWITTLNFRGTYGIQGNALTRLSPELILEQKGVKPGYNQYFSTITQIPNPHLSWERTKTWNFGLDLELFNMFYMNLEYYTRRSNAVVSLALPYEYGIKDMKRNGGIIRNRGVEYTLSFTPLQKRDYALSVSMNISKNWNKGGETEIVTTHMNFLNGKSDYILKEGFPLSAFWSYSFAGLDENGKPTFNLLDVPEEERDSSIDKTTYLVYSGQKEPDFTGGMGLSFRYKSLTLNTNFALIVGNKKRLTSPYKDFGGSRSTMPDPTTNANRDLLKRWKAPGDEAYTIIPALPRGVDTLMKLPDGETAESLIQMWERSDAMVVSGSFLRCRSMGLTWQMKREWCDKIFAKNLSLNFSVDNLFVIASKRFNGFDPELDNSVMPRTFSFGINVGF
ncbi:SusC/RagA family TonB-linked outer membrane protein [Bacteroides sp. GM023]|uniref:SusC/RagA family TonB-linked outer membrane protein n=1 Tax=Bacteroides sp. GM023 TaxID=2723058 RepID=UPI00168B8632|nr:SusC/RagA family TonB-linked outer membrane protein [Bacteroides sp. GM023]MBD3591479.1 SusC/RagA family TonB-linked outer membrane protein [Bacteroides sp. GM023]